MLRNLALVALILCCTYEGALAVEPSEMSLESQVCLSCHEGLTPGLVADWRASRHAHVTPEQALAKPGPERRFSAQSVLDSKRAGFVVGCYECHGLRPDEHKDSFDHFGLRISVVVSPKDCAQCHPVETDEYAISKKANAHANLMANPVYHALVSAVDGLKVSSGDEQTTLAPSPETLGETCLGCHGTEVKVMGMKSVVTPMGAMQFPDLANWPNQGVGRINPDGSTGSCTSCHPRHSFSIEVARKPYTCAQCHLDPDTPAWNVYSASKHGDIFLSSGDKWNWDSVPWRAGQDFTAPTCATCHVSQVVTPQGAPVAPRSHDFASRLWVRLFGLIYAHPQPKSGDTTVIRNKDGQPLPATFSGEPATPFLIDPAEQALRKARMSAVCRACHSTDWTQSHFKRLDTAIEETNQMTLEATRLMTLAWNSGMANSANPFDEYLEQLWIQQWLFYANTTRYASAMTGAHDYAAFKYGWWGLTTNLEKLRHDIVKKEKQAPDKKERHK